MTSQHSSIPCICCVYLHHNCAPPPPPPPPPGRNCCSLVSLVDVSNEDLDEIEDFMLTTHVLLACAFFLMMGLHSATVPISCRIHAYIAQENDDIVKDQELHDLREGQRYEREKDAFVGAARKKVEKEEKKHQTRWA